MKKKEEVGFSPLRLLWGRGVEMCLGSDSMPALHYVAVMTSIAIQDIKTPSGGLPYTCSPSGRVQFVWYAWLFIKGHVGLKSIFWQLLTLDGIV